MISPTIQNLDDAIKKITQDVEYPELNELCQQFGDLLEAFKQGQLALINELLAIYDSASEHNVDVGRDVLFELAQRLAGVEPPQESRDLESHLPPRC